MSTPSQTVGPFFEYALPYEGGERLVSPTDPEAIRLVGAVFDGDGRPVDDALIEIWQANRHGRYRHPEDTREDLPLEAGFDGFGRCPTDAEGRFEFVTVKPGATDGQAPHISVCVLARGLLRRGRHGQRARRARRIAGERGGEAVRVSDEGKLHGVRERTLAGDRDGDRLRRAGRERDRHRVDRERERRGVPVAAVAAADERAQRSGQEKARAQHGSTGVSKTIFWNPDLPVVTPSPTWSSITP